MGFPNNAFIKDFIILYKSHPALWQLKNPIYYSPHLRYKGMAALIEFSKKNFKGDVDEAFIKRKIKSLRTSFFREWNKVQKSKKENSSTQASYVPNLWYYDLISFISNENIYQKKVILSSTNDDLKNNMVEGDQNASTSDSVIPNRGDHVYSMHVQNHKHEPKEKTSPVSINSESDDVCVESGKIQDLNQQIDIGKRDNISYSLKYHKSSVPDTEVNMPRIKCPRCDLQFLKSEYSLHLERIHSYKCNLCDKTFVRVKTMQDHIANNHEMDGNTNQPTNILSFQTNQFQIVKNMPIHNNESQALNCSRNVAEHSLINDVHILPVNSIGMKNIEGVNKSRTHLNNILFDELDQFIEVHELPTDVEMTNIEIQNIGASHLNELQTHRNNSLIDEVSQFIEVNQNHHLNKTIMYKPCGSQIKKGKTYINKATGLQVDVKNNVSNAIPVIQQKGMKSCTSSMDTINNYTINNYKKVNHSFTCNICARIFVNRRTIVSHMQLMHKESTNMPKSIGNNSIIQSHPNLKPDTQIQSNITRVNKPGIQKKVEMVQELIDTTNIMVDLSNEMEINEYVNEQTHKNNIHEQQNEMLNRLHHNNQLQDAVAYPSKEKSPVTKHIEYVCNLCDSHLGSKRSLKRHSFIDHIINCHYCEKKFICGPQLNKHMRNTHAYNINKTLKLLPDNIKKDDLANQAAIYQINSDKNKDILSIASNVQQMHENDNVHKHGQLNEMLNDLHYKIPLQDTVAYSCDEKKPTIKHTEHVCDLCGGQFVCRSRLLIHSKALHKINCPYCDKKFARNSALKKHWDTVHSNITIRNIPIDDNICHICGGYFKVLKNHISAFHKFNCPHCDKKFVHKTTLTNHIKSDHDDVIGNSYILHQKHVDIPTNQLDEMAKLDYVKKDDLANQAAIRPINCNKNKSILLTAQNEILQNAVANPCDEKNTVIKHTGYVCDICGGQFNNNKILKNHTDANHKFNCPYCEKRFVYKYILTNHLKSAHADNNGNSRIIKKHIDTPKNQLDEMMKLDYVKKDDLANQAAIRPINCNKNKSILLTAQNEILQNAVANPCDEKKLVSKHTGFTCNICSGQFTNQRLFIKHSVKSHKFNCPHCKKKFVNGGNLKKHIGNTHAFGNKNEMLKLQPNNIKNNDLANQTAIHQINCTNNIGIFPIVSNDIHTHENNIQEHKKPNEIIISMPYHIQLQDTVAHPSDEKMHANKLGFICNSCGGQFTTKNEFNSHTGMDHKFKCSKCPNKFISNVTLDKHIQVMHIQHNENACMEKSYAVTLSQLSTVSQINCCDNNDVLQHFELQEQIANKRKRYICSICDLQYVIKSKFIRHVQYKHDKKCLYCNKKFIRKKTLKNHTRSMHGKHKKNSRIQMFIDKSKQVDEMSKLQSVDISMENLADREQFKCNEIKGVLPTEPNDAQMCSSNLSKFVKPCKKRKLQLCQQEVVVEDKNENFNEKDLHVCIMCSASFKTSSELKRHSVRIHKFNCPNCEKKFVRNKVLEIHESAEHNQKSKISLTTMTTNKHNTKQIKPNKLSIEPQFICEFCDSHLKNMYDLRYHSFKEHNFKCNLCVKKFIRISDMEKHRIYEHFYEKQNFNKKFWCEECNSRFTTNELLQLHIKYTHKLMPKRFTCSLCCNTFTDNNTFFKHIELNHFAQSKLKTID